MISKSMSVDILMPVRNAGETLPETLGDIAGQTLSHWRLIAVDDHSEDESLGLLRAFARRHGRTLVLPSEGRGPVAALNTGLRRAEAAIVARMDADDRMAPTRLERQVAGLKRHPDIGVVGCRVETTGLAGGFRHYLDWSNRLLSPEAIARARFIESPMVHPTVCFRRELADRWGGYREGDFPEDYELWLRWMQAGVHFGKIDAALLQWRDRPDRLTRVDPRYRPEAFFRVKAPYLAHWLRQNNPHGLRVWIWGAGRPTRLRLRPLAGQGIEIERFIDVDPRKIGTLNRDGAVVGPDSLPAPDQCFVLVAVSRRGAREEIVTRLPARGYREGLSFLCIA